MDQNQGKEGKVISYVLLAPTCRSVQEKQEKVCKQMSSMNTKNPTFELNISASKIHTVGN